MKKILLLMLLFCQIMAFGQTYQLPNGGFENWDGNGEPSNWNGFPSAKCNLSGLASLGCNSATATRHEKITGGRPGSSGSYCIRIYATVINVLGSNVTANGNLTTGQIIIGSTTPTNTSNCNKTLTSDNNFNQPLTGKPDSIRFWAKFSCPSTTQEARMSAYIHTANNFQDPSITNEANYIVANSTKQFTTGDGDWHEYTQAFNYTGPATTPAYLLLSFTTNQIAGAGSASDYLWIDDVELVYNARLASLSASKGTLSPAFDPDITNYIVTLCEGENLPTFNYTTASAYATVATANPDGQTTFTITQGNAEKTYTVTYHFTSAPDAPTATDMNRCGPGPINLIATAPAGSTCRWYGNATGGEPISSNITNITTNTTYYVASYSTLGGCESARIPMTVTITATEAPYATTNGDRCGNGTVKLSAEVGGDAVCRWYSQASGGSLLSTTSSNEFFTTPTLSSNTTYYVEAYDALIGCPSPRTEVYATINPIPEVPTCSNQSICGSGEVYFEATAGTNGTTCNWYTSPEGTIPTESNNTTYTANVTATTSFYVTTLNGTTGCESSKKEVQAIVNPIYNNISFQTTACGFYTWNNENFTANGNYTRTLQTVAGCDSIVTLELTIRQPQQIQKDTTVCSRFVWNGTTYTTSGTVSQTFTAVSNGCDSVVSYHLTVLEPATFKDTVTIYTSQLPYTYNGQTYNAAGNYNITLTGAAANGCDSIITFTLIVNLAEPGLPSNVRNADRCGNGTVILSANPGANCNTVRWYNAATEGTLLYTGSPFTTPELSATTLYYVSSYNSSTQLESGRVPVTATLHPTPATPTVSNVSRCGAGEITLNATAGAGSDNCRWFINNTTPTALDTNLTYTTSISNTTNYYVASYNETTHCSSSRIAVTATVQSIPAVPTVTQVTGCENVSLTLSATPAAGTTCKWYSSDNSYLAEGNSYMTPVLFSTTQYKVSSYSTTTTCESGKAVVIATINPVYHTEFSEETCGSYTWNNHTYTTSGDQTQTFQSAKGCDSIVTLHLTILPKKSSSISHTACNSYQWYGQTYTVSGQYQHTVQATNGCDSIITLNLTVHHAYHTEFNDTACDQYIWNNETYTTSGNKVQRFTAATGCDSIVTLHLTIYNSVTKQINVTACNNHNWNGNTYTQSGQYVSKGLTTTTGCDSIVTLNLTIHHSSRDTISATICKGETYHQYGFNLTPTTVGTFYNSHTETSSNGCDSITVLKLKVNPTYFTNRTASICEGSSYHFYGKELTAAGIYDTNLRTVAGCDSIIHLTLTLGQDIETVLNVDICNGETYTENGFNESVTGTYTQLFSDRPGACDSLVILNLTVHALDTTYLTESICLGETFNENGFNITPTQLGSIQNELNVTNQWGCDSTIYLTLTTNPTHTVQLRDTLCLGERYTQNGFDTLPAHAGLYTITHHNSNLYNCDSTTHLSLVVLPSYQSTIQVSVCESELPYSFGSQSLTHSGNYSEAFQTVAGCDSIIHLNFEVNIASNTALIDTICLGERYHANGFDTILVTAGNIVCELFTENSKGCDSIVTLTLTVIAADVTNFYDTICLGERYTAHGFDTIPTHSGSYLLQSTTSNAYGCNIIVNARLQVNPVYNIQLQQTICLGEAYREKGFDTIPAEIGIMTLQHLGQTSNGCDSNITVTLTITPSYYQTLDIAVCESELPYYYQNIAYTEAGNYNIPFESTAGCDSIVALNLTVNPTYNLNTTVTICESQLPYITGQDTLTSAGQYVINRNSINGCDSIVNLYLIVNSNLQFTQTQSICESALPYQFGDSTFTEAGIYEVVFEANNGCDSIINLTLQVLDTYFTEENVTIMDNEVYVWHSMTLNTNGTYLDTVTSSTGCDSICQLNLTVLKTYLFEETAAICEGENYTWRSRILERSGLYFDSLKTVSGGDSIYQLTLTVHPTSLDIQQMALCNSQLPYQWHGLNLTENGIYHDTLQTTTGCDSIFVLNLTIHHTNDIDLYDTTCQGEIYQLNGFNIACDTAGNYVREMTFTNQYQCDSIVTLHLTVQETIHTVVAETACISYTWNNQTYYASGTYSIEFPMQNGCDSVVVLNLTIQLPVRDTVYQTACGSYTWNGTTYSESGTYSKLFTGGICDSTAVLILTVNQPSLTRLYDTLCLGERYHNYGFDTIPATAGNMICQAVYTNAANCDSTVILTLTVHASYLMEDVVTVCDNDAPYAWHNQNFTTSGIYYDSLISVNGCDSIHQLVLTINPTYNIEISDSVAVGEHYLNNGLDFTPSQIGSFNFTTENVSSANCDSIVHLTLIVYESTSIDSYGIGQFITIFPNPTKNFFTVSSNQSVLTQIDIFDVSGRNVQTQCNINDYTKELSVENYAPGIYFVKIYTKDGTSTKKLIVQ